MSSRTRGRPAWPVKLAAAAAAAAVLLPGQAQAQTNDAAAALMAAAEGQQAAAGAATEQLPFHMMPAAADWDKDGGDLPDPLEAFRGLLDGLDEAGKADIMGLDAENGAVRSALSGALNANFLQGGGMLSLLRSVSAEEAATLFSLFPPVQKMPAWQSFLAQGGSADDKAAAAAAAQVKSTQELGQAMAVLATLGSSPESVMSALRDFTSGESATADPELHSLMQELDQGGGGQTIERIQEKFLQRTLGADSTLRLSDFTDPTWLEAARTAFFQNEDLLRLIGDERVLSLLANPDMVPRKPSDFPDPETLLEAW